MPSDSKIRNRPIALFVPTLHPSGAERIVLNLAQGMVQRGEAVDLVLGKAAGALLQELPPEVRLIDLQSRRIAAALFPLIRYLRSEQPRALVSHLNHCNIVALWGSRLAGNSTPVVVTVHNSLSQTSQNPHGLGDRLGPYLLRRYYPWAKKVVAVSRGAADDLVALGGLSRESIEVIYNPVVTPGVLAQLGQTPGHPWFANGSPPVILGAGRLTRQKDFPTLIRAFSQLRHRRSARLLILGEGVERPALTALIQQLGLEDSVELPGFRPDVLACMRGSAVFALSSAWEGLPTVLIEALAAGTRVVSTDCKSGPREILQNGRLGALVPVGDPAALAQAIDGALDCPRVPPPADALAPYTLDVAVEHYLRVIRQIEFTAGGALELRGG